MERKQRLLSLMQDWEKLATEVGMPHFEALYGLPESNSQTALTDALTNEIQEVIQAFENKIFSEEDFKADWENAQRAIQAILNQYHFPLQLREALRKCFAWAFPEPLTEGITL